MAFSLIDDAAGAVPLTALTKAQLAAWRESAPARERDWAASIGFTGEAGKTALVPDKNGKLGRVLVGVGESEAAMWAVAGLSETLPEGSYRLDPLPEGADASRVALGWALGTYAFTRYHAKPAGGGAAGVAGGRRSRPCRAARRRDLPRPRPGHHPGLRHGAGGTGRRGAAGRQGRRARAAGSSSATSCSPRTTRRSTRSAAPAPRPPRLVDIVWGDEDAPKVTLVGKGVCFDTGGLDLKPASGMLNMKKDMAGAAIMLGLGQAIMQAGLQGAAARAAAAGRELGRRATRCGRATSSRRARG